MRTRCILEHMFIVLGTVYSPYEVQETYPRFISVVYTGEDAHKALHLGSTVKVVVVVLELLQMVVNVVRAEIMPFFPRGPSALRQALWGEEVDDAVVLVVLHTFLDCLTLYPFSLRLLDMPERAVESPDTRTACPVELACVPGDTAEARALGR